MFRIMHEKDSLSMGYIDAASMDPILEFL
jgi:hypothetical protein